jgi:hypothetical protein
MLAFYCDGDDIKKFMALVLNDTAFDRLQLRSGELMTRARFEIDGRLNRDFDGIETERAYCLWGEVRHNVFDLIKGKKLPKYIKLVFALDDAAIEQLHPNAKAAFINMVFENGKITFTTGTAQKNFSMDKGLDEVWEHKVKEMFNKLGISINIL